MGFLVALRLFVDVCGVKLAAKDSRLTCPECGKVMAQEFVGLKHCTCGMSWKKDSGFFKRTPDMYFALEYRNIGGKNKQVPVVKYRSQDNARERGDR